MGACAVLLGAWLYEGSAFAYQKSRVGSNYGVFGNSAFAATYNWSGETIAKGRGTYFYGWGWDTIANQTFDVRAQVFGLSKDIVNQYIEAESTSFQNGTPQMDHKKDTWMVIKVLDVQVANPRNQTSCATDPNSAVACLSYSLGGSRTFFSQSASFSIAGIPITVGAQVLGNFHAGGSSSARAGSYLGLNPATFSIDSTSQNVGAYVTTALSAGVGIGGVASAGVTGSFRLIDISITPNDSVKQVATPSTYSISSTIALPMSITSMGGGVDLWAELAGIEVGRMNLVSWQGFQLFNQTVLSDVQSFSGSSSEP